ncbi:MAG: ABC transporter ATP-binding protein [Candidatus Aminicenantes bacterium]|nr:ABC transporter ATP-binding protein [Candidatus Aminicenantes bacterium]TFG57770.1 MAG: ABC transporter ATP-binding protein [Candidatus Aminicenantes bacterium]
MNPTPAILTESLVKRYPVFRGFRDLVRRPFEKRTTTALDGLDLRVERGRVFCLLGPNGAGKTTLIKILATLVLPDGGRASVDGHDVDRHPGPVKSAVGFAINDERSFYWRLTGRQNLEFFGALYGLNGQAGNRRIDDVLRLTRLEAAAGLRFNAYSTGMRQMLAFARALLADASILLVDEPTRSLDPQAADRIGSFLRGELVEGRGKTVFWATHDLAEAAAFAHEIAVIDRGRIRLQGTLESLTGNGRTSLRQVYENAVSDPPESR